jgi:hypothetical protein
LTKEQKVKLKKSIAALCAAGLLGLSGSASAAIVVNDWTLDFGAIGGSFAGYGQLKGIDVLNYTGLFNSVTNLGAGTETTNFLINTGTVNGSVAATSTGKILGFTTPGAGVELTGYGQTVGNIIDVTGTTYTTRNTSGFLYLYAGLPGGLPNGLNGTADTNSTSATRGSGMGGPTDASDPNSVLIATFKLIDDGTGSIFSSTLATGATKADFELVSTSVPNLLLDKDGNNLAIGSLLALTDAQTNVDPNGSPPTSIGTFTIPTGPLAGTCGTNFENVCGVENGNARVAVPEPGSLARMGLSLLGLVSIRRRK